MSVLGLDGRKWPGVSQDASPQHRTPADEATILPLLKRLRQSELQDVSNSKIVHLVSPVERSVPPIESTYAQQDASPSPEIPLSLTGRVVIVLSLVGLLATGAVIFLAFGADHPASAVAPDSREAAGLSDMDGTPEMKRAATARPETTTVGETGPSTAVKQSALGQSGTGFAERDEAAGMNPEQPRSEAAFMFRPPLLNLNGVTIPAVLAPESTVGGPHRKAGAKKSVRRHQANHATHRVRPRETQSAAVKPQEPRRRPAQPQEATPPAETQANAVRPTKKLPLQSALDELFAGITMPDNGASNRAAPATGGSAYSY